MSHLKVELHSLKRNRLYGYGFDLTRFCSVCWSKLGRIINRGARCRKCHRKVCKSCRICAGESWICFTCHRKNYKGRGSWNKKVDLRRPASLNNETYFPRMADSGIAEAYRSSDPLTKHKVKQYRSGEQKTPGEERKKLGVRSAVFLKQRDAGKIYAIPKDIPIAMAATCPRKMPPEGYRLRRENNSFIVDVQPERSDKEFLSDLESDYVDPVQRWLLNCYGKEISGKPTEISKMCCEPHLEFNSRMPEKRDQNIKWHIASEKRPNSEKAGSSTSPASHSQMVRGVPVQDSHMFAKNKSSTVVSRSQAATDFSRGNPFGIPSSNNGNSLSTSQHRASENISHSSPDASSDVTPYDLSSINKERFQNEIERLWNRCDFGPDVVKVRRSASLKTPPVPPPKLVRNASSPLICKKVATDAAFVRAGNHRRFSCHEIRRMNRSDKDKRREVGESAKSSPSIYRSVSLPSPSLSEHQEYDPYRWYSSSVKERVQRLERDLAGSVKADWVSSQSDIYSMNSLDSDRIAPDGDNYQLVFINSSAASQDSDLDDTGSFSRRMRKAYRLSRSVSDTVDWDLSFDSSVDDLSSLTEEGYSGFTPKSVKNEGMQSFSIANVAVHNQENSSLEKVHDLKETSGDVAESQAEEKVESQEFAAECVRQDAKTDNESHSDNDGVSSSDGLPLLDTVAAKGNKSEISCLISENIFLGVVQNRSRQLQETQCISIEEDERKNCFLNAVVTGALLNEGTEETMSTKSEKQNMSLKGESNGETCEKKVPSEITPAAEVVLSNGCADGQIISNSRCFEADCAKGLRVPPQQISVHHSDTMALENDISNKNDRKEESHFICNGSFALQHKANRFRLMNERAPFPNGELFSFRDNILPLLSFDVETDPSKEYSTTLRAFRTDKVFKFSSMFFKNFWGQCTLMTGTSFLNSSPMCIDTVNHNGLAISQNPNNNGGRVRCVVHCHGPRLFVTEMPDTNNILSRRGFSFDWRRDFRTEADISPLSIDSFEREPKKEITCATKELLQVICEFLVKTVSVKMKYAVQLIIQCDRGLTASQQNAVAFYQPVGVNGFDSSESKPFSSKKSSIFRSHGNDRRDTAVAKDENKLLSMGKCSREKSAVSRNKRDDDRILMKAKCVPTGPKERNTSSGLKEEKNNRTQKRNHEREKLFYPRITNSVQVQTLKQGNPSKYSDLTSRTRYFCVKRRKVLRENKMYSSNCALNQHTTGDKFPKVNESEQYRTKLERKERHVVGKTVFLQSHEKRKWHYENKSRNAGNLILKINYPQVRKINNMPNGKENKGIICNSLEKKESLVLHSLRKCKKIKASLLEHRRRHFQLESFSDFRCYLLLKNKITKMESNVRINFGAGKSAQYKLSCGSVKSEIHEGKEMNKKKKKHDQSQEPNRGIITKSSSRKCLACSFLRNNRSTKKLGLAEGTSEAATFSSNRKKTNPPAFRSRRSHDPNAKEPGGTGNAAPGGGGRRGGADVPRGFTRSENPPETGVIDTRATSETGSAAFVELRPTQKSFPGAAPLECERHPPFQLGLTVPADQAAERGHRHSESTFERGESVCSVPYSTAREGGPGILLRKRQNRGVPTVDYINNVLDYGNGTTLPPFHVAGRAKLTASPSTSAPPNCHARRPGIYSQLGSEMSASEISRECDKHVRVYGTKVSQLKRFFDSCANSSCEPSLEFEEQNSDDKCVEQGLSMESYQQQVDSVEQIQPIPPNESDSFSLSVKEDKQNNVDTLLQNNSPGLSALCDMDCSSNCSVIKTAVDGTGEIWEHGSEEHGLLWKGFNGFSSGDHADMPVDPLTFSTAELNSLIAASRAELSKIEQPLNSRSSLENYFTNVFDSDRLKHQNGHAPHQVKNVIIERQQNAASGDPDLSPNGSVQKTNSHCCESYSKNCDLCYECDVREIAFDDVDDAALSDTSSEDETHYSSLSSGAHFQQAAYALHTIIEESCEESERDSRSVTPTNLEPTSKLERYFSWDIINDAELKRVDVEDSSSTIFSDSLSEGSDSINDVSRELEPSHLASSRLEKYFMSGLLGNENFLYPDDAEFLDDMPVSDFEEESNHKISRSALLNSLELNNSIANIQNNLSSKDNANELTSICNQSYHCVENDESDAGNGCSENLFNMGLCARNNSCSNSSYPDIESQNNRYSKTGDESEFAAENADVNVTDESICSSENNLSVNEPYPQEVAFSDNANSNLDSQCDIQNTDNSTRDVGNDEAELEANTKNKLKNISEKEYFDESAQAIMKKIIVHLSDNSCPVGTDETSYYSAWKILETEIERMMQTVSPHLDHPNYNGGAIDSNNSDYGSDTVESVECLTTDEDDNCTEGKLQNCNSSQVRDLMCNTNRNPSSFISEETLDIWRKLMVSLKKDTLSLAQQDNCDEYTKARLYIRDQIIALMHTVTTSQANSPTENRKKSVSPPPSDGVVKSLAAIDALEDMKSDIVETAVEVPGDATVNESPLVLLGSEDKVKLCLTVDEGISVDSTENISVDVDTVEDISEAKETSVDIKSPDSPSKEHQQLSIPSEILLDLSEVIQPQVESCKATSEISDDAFVHPKYLPEDEANACSPVKENCSGDNGSQLSVYVDIKLDDEKATVTERRSVGSEIVTKESSDEATKRSSVHLWLNDESSQPLCSLVSAHSPGTNSSSDSNFFPSQNTPSSDTGTESTIDDDPICEDNQCLKVEESQICAATSRDTGYYSFKSSEDSILSISDSGSQDERIESPVVQQEICAVRESNRSESADVTSAGKQTVPLNLSLSTNNIPESVACAETKFCTLPPKPTVSKVSMHPQPSVPATTSRFFSPSAAFKKLATSKSYGVPSEMTIPSKYLKKYARSSSVDDESIFGATSMPHLSTPNLTERSPPQRKNKIEVSHLTGDSDRESSLTLDDETDTKRKYSSSSHSVLSLGSHSASMTSVYSAAGGRHFGYVSVSGDVLFGLNYNQKSQMMEVFVKQCRNLAAVDAKRNKSDPYVKVYLLPDKTKGGKRKTKTKKNTLNPIFNELLRFPVLKHELDSRTLWLSVWNSDLFGRNDFLGEVMLALGYRLLDSPTLRWYPLQERSESPTSPLNYKGELFLALKYVPRDLSLESRFRPAPVISLRGALHVLVKEARNIMAMRSNGTSDPFCKSYLLPDKSKNSKQKTPIVKKTRHPKWYYTVVYEDLSVEELKERSLELTLWDHDKLTSNEFMGGIRLNTGTGLYHGVSVEWMDARRDEAALWQAMLERPNMWVDGSLPLRPTMQFIRN